MTTFYESGWKPRFVGGAITAALGFFIIVSVAARLSGGCLSGQCTEAFFGAIWGFVTLAVGVGLMLVAAAVSLRD